MSLIAKRTISTVEPIKLFGQVIPNICRVKSRNVTLGLIATDGAGHFKQVDAKLNLNERASVARKIKVS